MPAKWLIKCIKAVTLRGYLLTTTTILLLPVFSSDTPVIRSSSLERTTYVEMVHRIQLMDLPVEILTEIIALVPYEISNWSNLRQVSRRFCTIMSTRGLQTRAAKVQFDLVYELLPELFERSPMEPCKYWSSQIRASLEPLREIEGQAAELVELGVTLIHMITVHILQAIFHVRRDDNEGGRQCTTEVRKQLYFLRLTRLLPSAFNSLVRYSALKLYECHYLDASLSFATAQSQNLEADSHAVEQFQTFLDFEHDLTQSPNWACTSKYAGRYLRYKISLTPGLAFSPIGPPPGQCLLAEQIDRYCPSAITTARAMNILQDTSYAYPTKQQQTGFPDFYPPLKYSGNDRMEAAQQMRFTKELRDQIESKDSDYANQISWSLDPKAVKPIMIEQARMIAQMSGEAVQRALFEEIELLLTRLEGVACRRA